jgi:glutamyl/glutaminyl-tRNA synthetase
MPGEQLLARSIAHAPVGISDRELALQAIELHRTRARTTIELGRALGQYAQDPDAYDPEGIRKQVRHETPALLNRLIHRYESAPEWTSTALEAALRSLAEESGAAAGKLIHPVRLALTGTMVGAPLFDVLELLGKETALRRMKKFLEAIHPHTPA